MAAPNLERFKQAQADRRSGFDAAVAEIRAGAKRGHWIWYVLPQLSGLGTSDASTLYAIDDAREAEEYLRDPLLFSRLRTIVTAIAEQLRDGRSLTTLMGSRIDALKTVSSLTLFGEVSRRIGSPDASEPMGAFLDVAQAVLRAAEAEGYSRCRHTLDRLRGAERT